MEGWEGRRGREQRSHSSRSIGVPEVIGNDKVGKMRGKKWNGEAAIGIRDGRDPKRSMEDHLGHKKRRQKRGNSGLRYRRFEVRTFRFMVPRFRPEKIEL